MHLFLYGIIIVIAYFLVAASAALGCRMLIRIPDELFRKILHCILLGSLPAFVFGFQIWWHAALAAVVFALVVYPILVFFERYQTFSKLTTERKKGELKHSLLLVFFMFAFVISVCWGWLREPWLVLASIYAWGFGDAAAALVGKRFGKHKVPWKHIDHRKSFEGSAAMGLVSFGSVLILLICRGGLGAGTCVAVSLGTAAASTVAELCSKDGMDTVICPVASMVVLLPLLCLFGSL